MKKEMSAIECANSQRYSTGEQVEEYLKEPYHRLRIEKSVQMLKSYLQKNFKDVDIKDRTILEIAGSTGMISAYLKNQGYDVILTDIGEDALKKAINNYPTLKTMYMDASNPFPFPNDSFHAIYAGEIIEHLFDTKLFFSECARCLKDNGVLIITTPNLATLQDRIKFLLGKSPRQIDPTHNYLYLHIRPFTVSKLKEISSFYNFANFKVTTNMVLWRLKNKKIVIPLIGKIAPSLGGTIILGCCKKSSR